MSQMLLILFVLPAVIGNISAVQQQQSSSGGSASAGQQGGAQNPYSSGSVVQQGSYTYTCLVGTTACENQPSYMMRGNTIECCRSGDSMSSFTSNGISSCLCGRGGISLINGRPMTPEEKQEFDRRMNAWQNDFNAWQTDFQKNMNTWQTNLQQGMNNMQNNLNNMFQGSMFQGR